MGLIRKHIAFRFLWLAMALNLLNCSIDSPDPQPSYVREDLSYNDMESIVEVILEKIMFIDNAIVEYDDSNDDNTGSFSVKKSSTIYYCQQNARLSFSSSLSGISEYSFAFHKKQYPKLFCPEIVPPPPKV